jgi:hypothetical protein
VSDVPGASTESSSEYPPTGLIRLSSGWAWAASGSTYRSNGDGVAVPLSALWEGAVMCPADTQKGAGAADCSGDAVVLGTASDATRRCWTGVLCSCAWDGDTVTIAWCDNRKAAAPAAAALARSVSSSASLVATAAASASTRDTRAVTAASRGEAPETSALLGGGVADMLRPGETGWCKWRSTELLPGDTGCPY